MNQVKRSFSLLLVATVLFTQAWSQNTPVSTGTPSTNKFKWNMFGLNRVHIQDFGISDQYLDTCTTCGDNNRFLGKANSTVGLSFYNNLSEKVAFSADFGVGYGYISRNNASAADAEKKWSSSARADLYYHFYDSRLQVQPFIYGGMQASLRAGDALLSMPVGLGARYMIMNNNGMITAQVGYGLGLSQRMRNHVNYSWGLYINLGKKKKQTEKTIVIDAIDSDGDGVVDAKDKCVNEPGPVNNNGCPMNDRDKDGVMDEKDKCPDVPGSIINEGCPVLDRDGDGVSDNFDKCPDLAGSPSNHGCPDDKPKVVEQKKDEPFSMWIPEGNHYRSITGDSLRYIIYFEFDDFKLKDQSYSLLREVENFLKKNSNWEVVMEGHTDLEGDVDYNLKLSEKRAKVGKQYLMSYGIKANRISTDFFGKSKPVVPTFEERLGWMNRRVEAILVRKK
jgi:outer membrane protein OmpA-like peptidoglycan-associated protein